MNSCVPCSSTRKYLLNDCLDLFCGGEVRGGCERLEVARDALVHGDLGLWLGRSRLESLEENLNLDSSTSRACLGGNIRQRLVLPYGLQDGHSGAVMAS